ncbi:hypothetical protein Tco_1438480 [Tanacetum coccineum]
MHLLVTTPWPLRSSLPRHHSKPPPPPSPIILIKTSPDWLKPIPEEERPKTSESDWAIPPNDLPETKNNWATAIINAYKDLEENKLIEKTKDMRSFIKWYYKQIGKSKLSKADLEDHIDLVNPKGNRVVPDVSKPLPLGGPPGYKERRNALLISKLKVAYYPDFRLEELVPSLADYKEYKILVADFKNLHPNDFEDLYLLHLHGNLNHLSGADKSYQTKLNLTQPSWDATDFLFKEDYIVVHKRRAVIYIDRNNLKKMMRESKVHKFSDGTLTRILEKMDHMVKDYVLFKFNSGMEHRIWPEDDKKSKEFIEVIERRLKIRRIFRSLESFVSGRLRDVDYRLI